MAEACTTKLVEASRLLSGASIHYAYPELRFILISLRSLRSAGPKFTSVSYRWRNTAGQPSTNGGNSPIANINLDGLESVLYDKQWSYIFHEIERNNETIYGRTPGEWQHQAIQEELFTLGDEFFNI